MIFENGTIKIGFKEVLKALSENKAEKLFIAEDSSESMKDKLTAAANGCEILYVSTMRELGKMCAIDVGASCAAQLKN